MRLKKFVEDFYPQIDFNVVFQAPMIISNLFPFKDKIKNKQDRSLVVYSMRCKTCETVSIGKTERILDICIKIPTNLIISIGSAVFKEKEPS